MKLGAVPYLNALPLIRYLPERPRLAPPAELDRLLKVGELDLATAPIVTLFENPAFRLVPGIMIGTRGTVRSVRLVVSKPGMTFSDLRSVSLDPESRTSVILLKVLFHHKYRRHLSEIRFSPLPMADAALQIGNRAMQIPPVPPLPKGGERESIDLGEEWTSWTGLPFVFAAWIGRSSECPPELVRTLTACRDHALSHLEDAVNAVDDFPRDEACHYLAENISYELGEAEKEGMKRFHAYGRELGFFKNDFRLEFYPEG